MLPSDRELHPDVALWKSLVHAGSSDMLPVRIVHHSDFGYLRSRPDLLPVAWAAARATTEALATGIAFAVRDRIGAEVIELWKEHWWLRDLRRALALSPSAPAVVVADACGPRLHPPGSREPTEEADALRIQPLLQEAIAIGRKVVVMEVHRGTAHAPLAPLADSTVVPLTRRTWATLFEIGAGPSDFLWGERAFPFYVPPGLDVVRASARQQEDGSIRLMLEIECGARVEQVITDGADELRALEYDVHASDERVEARAGDEMLIARRRGSQVRLVWTMPIDERERCASIVGENHSMWRRWRG